MAYTQKEIVDYYNSCESDYKWFWNLGDSMAMHAGFWDHTTRTLPEALNRENQILSELAKVTSNDHVLDAGCGVGGSSIYLAKRYNCRVTGITLSSHQVEKAKQFAAGHGVCDQTEFKVMDFCHTDFPDQSFDVVWAIESVCHAENFTDFLKEAHRILKPKGRLVIADGFLADRTLKSKENRDLNRWLSGWKVGSLPPVSEFLLGLKTNGFTDTTFQDVTKNIMPSSRRLFYLSIPILCFSKIGEFLNLRKSAQTDNIMSAFYQHLTLKRRIWKYGIAVAEKKCDL
ncbi:MAG: methyltransferase domain-containing protein [Waddliaceae bacterium]